MRIQRDASVNLPRWGLKPVTQLILIPFLCLCKFTPLGFETTELARAAYLYSLCKFTPLGFETLTKFNKNTTVNSVNLPRWGLKPGCEKTKCKFIPCVNLPRWGLKRLIASYIRERVKV